MQSMTPIKSLRLLTPSTKKFEDIEDKGVVTSVHGIIDSEFPFRAAIYGKKESRLPADFRNNNVRIFNRNIKTIKLEMPVLGLERAVVYPKKKPSKLPLKKKILRKIINLDKQIPSGNKIVVSNESNKEIKREGKSVTFLNAEIKTDDQKIIKEETMRTKYSIKNAQRFASDTIVQQKYNSNDLFKDNDVLLMIKGQKSKSQLLQIEKLKDKPAVPNIINKPSSTITQPPICESPKCNPEGIQKRSSFESKIPKPKRFLKRIRTIKRENEQKESAIDSKTEQSKTSMTSDSDSKSISTINKSKTSQTETTSGEVSQTASKSSQSFASTSTIKERSSKVNIDNADSKKTEETPSSNKNNNKKQPVLIPVKAKVSTKPIKEIKSLMNEISINKKTHTTSNRSLKKK